MFESTVYILCFLASATCAWLLLTSYRRDRQALLLWSGLCFCLLAVNSVLVFVDIVMLPETDLLPLRQVTELVGLGILLYGFVWETE